MAATSLYSQLVTVVIPLYRNLLNDIERWAVERNLRVLAPERDIAVVCPLGLDLSPLEGLLGIETGRCRVERFDSQFFDGRRGYNRFMLNSELYSRFSESKFIAVCQTDVALFHDNLDYWCSLDYDYIGAPWLPARNEIEGWNVIKRGAYKLRRGWARLKGGFDPVMLKWKVGNGGFSLRRTSAMLRVLEEHGHEIEAMTDATTGAAGFEDVVWSVRVNELWHGCLRIPDAATAARFAIEGHPKMAMRLTGGKLPMGTHAFYRRRNRAFWSNYLDFNI